MSKIIVTLAIAQSRLFANWPETAISRLIEVADVVTMAEHACIHRSGETASYLYLIVTGSLQFTRSSAPRRGLIASESFSGDFYGLMPALTGANYFYTAICKQPSTLVRIPVETLRELINGNGRLASDLFAALGKRYRDALGRHESATTYSLREQIGFILYSLLERNAYYSTTGEVQISQGEIATMLGTRRQVVNRTLKELEAEEIVQVQYGRIKVFDIAKLLDLGSADK